MLIQATRSASALTLRALFYCALFIVVVFVHLGLTSALRAVGLGGGVALFLSGAAILTLVLFLVNSGDWVRERLDAYRELQRLKQNLPSGPCCIVWRSSDPSALSEEAMPWELAGPLRARYPRFARELGVEGVAILEFEVNAEGKAKNIGCVDVWPSSVFFEAAHEALTLARFQAKRDEHMRFGATFRVPFVFRIEGAAATQDRGSHAQPLRPAAQAARRVIDKVSGAN